MNSVKISILFFVILFNCSGKINSEVILYENGNNFLQYYSNEDSIKRPSRKGFNPFIPISVGVASFFYILNPIILYENNKIALGVTKEISVGFGDLGEHRLAFEYSYIFRQNFDHHFRLSYKYDYFLTSGIEPSHMLQGTGVLSFGAGYFNGITYHGVFPEITYGYSIRNHKLLIYPHTKLRFTYIFEKGKSNITDFSFGIMIGFANPFIEKNFRRYY
ncbi:MAG: hypothetical protein WC358_10635 [Ignavibacteria bacterium]|jgi:hypothetical protein